MNKANLFKRKVITQPNDKIQQKTTKFNWDQNYDKFLQISNHPTNSYPSESIHHQAKLRFKGKRKISQTDLSQIEPFRQIGNLMTQSLSKDGVKSFIKTKKVKLEQKSRNSNPQREVFELKGKKDCKYESNFQILKRQIEQLESMQILKVSTESKQESQQNLQSQFYQSLMDENFNNPFRFTVSGQFCSGKNISILQRQRQCIKKVIKNKKFRKYINPHKNLNDQNFKTINSFSQQNPEQKKISIVSLTNCQTQMNPTKSKNDLWQKKEMPLQQKKEKSLWKKKETPQIVKKYYRPQSCYVKRPSLTCKAKKNKIEISNYLCLNSICKKRENKSLKQINFSNLQTNDMVKTHKSKNEIVIVCI